MFPFSFFCTIITTLKEETPTSIYFPQIPQIMSEKFALKWNDFHSNWNQSLSQLRKDTEFSDVTLISDDKLKFSAHKILLASCSSMFKLILKENFNSMPLLYLGGVSSVNLEYLLDYIYHGEVNLYQEQLDSFLESAQKLEIEGLIGQESLPQDQEIPFQNIEGHKKQMQEPNNFSSTAEEMQVVKINDIKEVFTRRQPPSDVTKIDVTSLTPDETEEKFAELCKKIDGAWSCVACDYTSNKSTNVRRHAETHFDGLSYKCDLCNKEFRLSNSLNMHKYSVHKTKFAGQITV